MLQLIQNLKMKKKPELDNLTFAKLLRKNAEELGISSDMLKRSINTGFSGGEKKEIRDTSNEYS